MFIITIVIVIIDQINVIMIIYITLFSNLIALKDHLCFLPSSQSHINKCCISSSLFAGPQQNTPMLELNGYEKKPIAALINRV